MVIRREGKMDSIQKDIERLKLCGLLKSTSMLKIRNSLKTYILEHAFDGWKDTTEDNVMRSIDDFFKTYENFL